MPSTASRTRWRPSVLAALCAAPLCTAFGADDDTSAATACIYRSTIGSTKVLDNRNVLFLMRDKSAYNSALPKQCPAMHRGAQLSFAYADAKLCGGSFFTVMMRGGPNSNPMSYWDPATNKSVVMQGPSFVPVAICELGMFTPISPDEVADLIAITDPSRHGRRKNSRDAIKVEPVEPPRDSSATSVPRTE